MSERKRNLIQLNLDKVKAHSPHGRLFVEKYEDAPTLAERQGLLYNAIANGFILNETDMASAIRALDNESFAASSRADKAALVARAIQFFSGQASQLTAVVPLAKPQFTMADLENELLSDDGLLAKASASFREELLSKVAAKYGPHQQISDVPVLAETSSTTAGVDEQPPAQESEPSSQTVDVSEDKQEASLQVVRKDRRVIRFRNN